MIYAALAIGSLLLVAAGGLVWLVDRAYRGQLDAALERAAAAEARAAEAEAGALAAQPRNTVDALDVVASGDDERLLDAVFGPPDQAGWSAATDGEGGPPSLGNDADDRPDA